MALEIEIGVYMIAFTTSLVTTITLMVASRRFMKGEFKDFINWVISASVSFMLGSALNVFAVVLSGSTYGSTFLMVAGFAYVLMGACFIRAAFLLHDLSKVFGFAELESEFKGIAHETGKKRSRKK